VTRFYIDFEDDDLQVDAPSLDVEIGDAKVLGYLYGPNDEPIATLLDRRVVPFGCQVTT
jgi:hypothetical protein